jgi:hypothetical protein
VNTRSLTRHLQDRPSRAQSVLTERGRSSDVCRRHNLGLCNNQKQCCYRHIYLECRKKGHLSPSCPAWQYLEVAPEGGQLEGTCTGPNAIKILGSGEGAVHRYFLTLFSSCLISPFRLYPTCLHLPFQFRPSVITQRRHICRMIISNQTPFFFF